MTLFSTVDSPKPFLLFVNFFFFIIFLIQSVFDLKYAL